MPAAIRSSYSPNLSARDGHGLDADEAADFGADRLHERLALPQAVQRLELVDVLEVVARVQVREDRAGVVPRGARDLDHVFDLLAGLLGVADVAARRAERARGRGRQVPVEAGVRHVDAEVGPLQDADAAHLGPGLRLPRIPLGLGRDLDGIVISGARVRDGVGASGLHEEERGRRRERLDHGNVDPDLLPRGREHELEARAEPGARARDAPAVLVHLARLVDAHSEAEQLDLELDGLQHGSRPLSCRPRGGSASIAPRAEARP